MASPGCSNQSSAEEDASVAQRGVKRKRVALACSTCRERKVKCDGAKPVCTPCAKRGALASDCAYALLAQSAKRESEQEYIASLQLQIRALRAQTSHDNGLASPQAPPSASGHPDTRALPSNAGLSSLRTQASPTRPHSASHVPDTPPISAMGVTMIAEDQGTISRGNEYYGASSLVSLINGVASPSASPGARMRRRRASGTSRPRMNATKASTTSSSMTFMLQPQYALPPRKLADELLALYFDNNHIFYPWTHSQTFRKRYASLWNSSDPLLLDHSSGDVGLGGEACPEDIFICALNAMFALGCQFSDYPSTEKDAASATFCERVRGLLHFDFLDNGSIACVQALLLFGLYLQCTNFPERCWNIIGLAYRMAVGLGLQSASPPEGATPLEIAMRRRVWHACVQMDMSVCMTLGRPSTLRIAEDIPIPSTLDEEYLPLADTPPLSHPPASTFFVQNSKSARLLGKVLDQVYHSSFDPHAQDESRSSRLMTSGTLSAILNLDSELEDLESSSVDALRGSDDLDATARLILQRQRNVLGARLLHMRLILYRPCFTNYCALARKQSKQGQPYGSESSHDSLAREGLRTSVIQHCALVCARTACKLIESIRTATLGRATGAWWYGLFYTITCAVIIILAECTPRMADHFARGELEAAWCGCLEVLSHMSRGHSLAGQYIHSLKALRQRSQTMSGESTRTQRRDTERATQSIDVLPHNTFDTTAHPEHDFHQGTLRNEEVMYPYEEAQADPDNFFFPAFLGDWEADINSIINIV